MDIAIDTSVLIPFLRADRADLLGAYPGRFLVTDEVAKEIWDPVQKSRLDTALENGHLVQHPVGGAKAYGAGALFGGHPKLGAGEIAVFKVAIQTGCAVSTGDTRALRYVKRKFGMEFHVITAEDIVRSLAEAGVLTKGEAWRLRLHIRS